MNWRLALTVLALQAAAHADDWQSTLSADRFLTTWPNYANTRTDASLHYRHTGSDTFHAEADLRLRTGSSANILGNLQALNYSWTETGLTVGRMEPTPSFIRYYGVQDRLNQRVCYTQLDCVEGGMIGADWRLGHFHLGLQLMTLPDIGPSLSITKDGQLQSSDRWSDPPVQSVRIDGNLLPLRVGGQISGGAASLFRPGLRVGGELWHSSSISLNWISSLAVSQTSVSTDNDGVGFISGPNGSSTAIFHEVSAKFPYEQIHSLQLKVSNGIYSELSFASQTGGSSTGSGIFGAQRELFNKLIANVGVGALNIDRQTTPFIQWDLRYSLKAWRFTARGEVEAGKAILLEPHVGYALGRHDELFARMVLIQASDSAPFYAPIRANDFVGGGWTHVF